MRKLEFVQKWYPSGDAYREARRGPVSVTLYANSGRGATIYVMFDVEPGSGWVSSAARASATGDTDDDAITEAEALLRRDHPRAWELYASAVLVRAEVAA
jgi:hypothetical protein